MSSTIRATAPIHKNRTTTLGRINNFISKASLFNATNLWSQLYSEKQSVKDITVWSLPGGEGAWKKYTFEEIIKQDFKATSIGTAFGPAWTTHWFKLVLAIPSAWKGKEVHLIWFTGSEATIYSSDGRLLQGLSPDYREEYIIAKNYQPGNPITFYIEMACNTMFGASVPGKSDITPPDENRHFTLQRLDIAVFNRQVFKLHTDLEMLYQMADSLGQTQIGYQALFAANEMVNKITAHEITEAGKIADEFFAEGNGLKAHTLISVGHCHIDTAWLWPYSETIRKIARSWSAQIALLNEYTDAYFACSSALQYAWLKEYYPKLYEELKVAVSEGRFVPVGGAWVELDGNVPSGESFIRQFLYGQQFFEEEFGIQCKEFWLPDTFGYSAQIPQIIQHCGIQRFLTQKLSWNQINKMPNHSFKWEGIDGTEVLVHFPPSNTYNAQANIGEFLTSESNSEDKGRSNVGLILYGWGDGGGGPTRTMIERQRRLRNVDGVPRVQLNCPEYFWQRLELESHKLYKWVGELFLELHNGTYTTQAKIKWYNRKCEFLLYEVEFLLALALSSGKVSQEVVRTDMQIVDICWKDLMLNQFHDVLPGSCIQLVVRDAWELYAGIFSKLLTLRGKYHESILGASGSQLSIYNPLTWPLRSVIFQKSKGNSAQQALTASNVQEVVLDSSEFVDSDEGRYLIPNTFNAFLVELSPSGYTEVKPLDTTNPVTWDRSSSVFQNGQLKLEVSKTGLPYEKLSFTKKNGEVEAVYSDFENTGTDGGMIYIYDDVPLYWDAWDIADYHMETRKIPNFSEFKDIEIFAEGPIVGGYKWSGKFGNNGSSLTRYTFLRADSPLVEYFLIVDWKEDHKLLKVEFPLNVLAREATYEIQRAYRAVSISVFGHLKRNTHINTSWDWAKYEVCGHKWVDVSQADRGVTLITESKYGFSVRGNVLKMSLLKSAKNPDANADIHRHYIHYAIFPHEGRLQEANVIRRAYEFNYFSANNVPVLDSISTTLPTNWITIDHAAVILSTLKVAHVVPNSIVIRLYESQGGSANAKINFNFPVKKVQSCNGLEKTFGEDIPLDKNSIFVKFGPFKVQSFMLTLN